MNCRLKLKKKGAKMQIIQTKKELEQIFITVGQAKSLHKHLKDVITKNIFISSKLNMLQRTATRIKRQNFPQNCGEHLHYVSDICIQSTSGTLIMGMTE